MATADPAQEINDPFGPGTSLSGELAVQIEALEGNTPFRGLMYLIWIYVLIAGAIGLNLYVDNWALKIVSIFFIGARMHSLYVLNHDASHYSLVDSPKLNKLISTVFANWVFFHHPETWSYVMWRRVHERHHRFLATEMDPNYIERKMCGDTERPYSMREVLLQSLKVLLTAWKTPFVARHYSVTGSGKEAVMKTRHLNHLAALFLPFENDPEMETERRIKLFVFAIAFVGISMSGYWDVFLFYWMLPMYTTFPAILRFIDLSEHNWWDRSGEVTRNSTSIKPSILERVFISDLHRNHHIEHHLFQKVALYNLPRLSELLVANSLIDPPEDGYFS